MAVSMERSCNNSRSSDDSIDLDLSAGSSTFEDIDRDVQFGTQPYLFEPEVDIDEEANAGDSPVRSPSDNTDRLGNNDWCTCGHCPPMPTVTESVCCKEIPQVVSVLEEDPEKICIIEHHGFQPVCIHPSVLRTAYFAYRQQYEELPETNGRMRYIGYRQLARWCWGWLGKQVRVPLPACAVHKIRTTYPEENGQYRGFSFV
ncbi:uncharacterized protein LOC133199103 [Saccostrea echinata]|uniref:uncharacterized protein LOC133199103 n=1 Tax=Saccostrea echinata TaxID=191078 RepID=UPI002A80E4B2|nr:uncharacterized protein LOC133199103 [Saccostrea echinata]